MSTAVETVKSLTPAAQEVIRKVTAPIEGDDSVLALSERPDLVQLPSGPLNIHISVPPQHEKDLVAAAAAAATSTATQHPSASLNIPTIIFMHGLGCNSTIWTSFIRHAKLRDHFRIVTYDMPGCGLSPFGTFIGVTPEGDPAERVAKDDQIFKEVREYMGMGGDTHVVAHSMGCRAVERYLMTEENVEFKKIFLISPNVPQNSTTQNEMSIAITSMIFEQGLPLLRKIWAERSFSQSTNENKPWAIDFVDAMYSLPTNRVILIQLLSLSHPPLDRSAIFDKAISNKFELSVIQGKEDGLVKPSAREELDKSYGSCSAVKYLDAENVGHWIMVEDYETLANMMKESLGFEG